MMIVLGDGGAGRRFRVNTAMADATKMITTTVMFYPLTAGI